MAVDFNPQIQFDEQDQQGDELCWIAVAVSVKHHFDPPSQMKQCGLARTLLGISGPCCTASDGVRKKCDQPGRLEDALGHSSVDHLARSTTARPNPIGGGAMTFAEVKAQIDNQLPVCVYIHWPGEDIGHFILISGYQEVDGRQYVYVMDPRYGGGPMPYNRVVSNYNLERGKWQFSYRLKA
ncbi:MAG: papain-like cysteine protease family protein [Candidatus Solibacter sp.]